MPASIEGCYVRARLTFQPEGHSRTLAQRRALSREKNEQHHDEHDGRKGADKGHHVRGSIHGLRPQAFD
jgi:hypothetical protein